MAGGAGVRAAVPDAHPAQRLYAHSSFWLSKQPHSTAQTGGDPALPVTAAPVRSDNTEFGIPALLAMPPL